MNITEETLLEIEDYINYLEERVGLKPETVLDVQNAINRERNRLRKICPNCSGNGWTAEHAQHPHEDGDCCGQCPVQVQCENCCGTGLKQ